MRVFLTGGTGLLGGEVARRLVQRGDTVRALVRDPGRAEGLRGLGCELVHGDLSDEGALVAALSGCSGLVHCAEQAGIGVPECGRSALVDTNVCGTERMLGAALTSGVHKAVHLSSIEVLGDTGGVVADERWTRDPALPWRSAYEETKAVAHGRAQDLGARGLPVAIVAPGSVYGPGDRSALGVLLRRVVDGRVAVLPFADRGLAPVHRDDAAEGVVAALDKGIPGESYVLAGEPVRLGELVGLLAQLAGRRAPRSLPTPLLRLLAPAGARVGSAMGLAPNVAELLRACDGVTSWASSDKAGRELAWTARPLSQGLADLLT